MLQVRHNGPSPVMEDPAPDNPFSVPEEVDRAIHDALGLPVEQQPAAFDDVVAQFPDYESQIRDVPEKTSSVISFIVHSRSTDWAERSTPESSGKCVKSIGLLLSTSSSTQV